MEWYQNKKHREYTKQVWQPSYERELTDEDADEITRNVVQFFKILMECDTRQKIRILAESEVYCNNCSIKIEDVADFHRLEDRKYCTKCFKDIMGIKDATYS